MKDYISEIIDLTGDSYLNPVGAAYGDGSGTHQRALNQITTMSVHHDATPRPHDYDSVARYRQEAVEHYNRLGPGLQYHFKIDNVGQIFAIRPLTTWLYVVGSAANTSTIAVCLDGYFHPDVNQKPTREQYEALSQLIIYMMTQRPDVPRLNYPDVMPHSYFSSTACCGDTLRPYVLQVEDTPTAQNIPTDVVYDWPSLQPTTPAVPAQPTVPVTPPPTPPAAPAWVQDNAFKPASYVAQVKTHLDGLETGKRFADYAPGEKFDMVARFTKDGAEPRLLTAYAVTVAQQGKRELAGIPEKDLITAQNSTATPTPPSTTPAPPPPVVTTPPTPTQAEQDHNRLNALELVVKQIVDFLNSIFKNWR